MTRVADMRAQASLVGSSKLGSFIFQASCWKHQLLCISTANGTRHMEGAGTLRRPKHQHHSGIKFTLTGVHPSYSLADYSASLSDCSLTLTSPPAMLPQVTGFRGWPGGGGAIDDSAVC